MEQELNIMELDRSTVRFLSALNQVSPGCHLVYFDQPEGYKRAVSFPVNMTEGVLDLTNSSASREPEWLLDPTEAVRLAREKNQQGYNIYFHVNTGKPSDRGRLRKQLVEHIRAVHVECDPPEDMVPGAGHEGWLKESCASLDQAGASFVWTSGRGVQALWLLPYQQEAIAEVRQTVRAMNRACVAEFGGDPAAIDEARILKLPGMVSYPSAIKATKGWQPIWTQVVGGTGISRTADQLNELELRLGAHMDAGLAKESLIGQAATGGVVLPAVDVDLTDEKLSALAARIVKKLRGGRNAFYAFNGWKVGDPHKATSVWWNFMHAAAEITDSREAASAALLSLPFVDRSDDPQADTNRRTRRQKCEDDFTYNWPKIAASHRQRRNEIRRAVAEMLKKKGQGHE